MHGLQRSCSTTISLLFSDLPTFDPVDDVYGGAAEGMADASDFPVDDEEIPDTGMSLRNPMVNSSEC